MRTRRCGWVGGRMERWLVFTSARGRDRGPGWDQMASPCSEDVTPGPNSGESRSPSVWPVGAWNPQAHAIIARRPPDITSPKSLGSTRRLPQYNGMWQQVEKAVLFA